MRVRLSYLLLLLVGFAHVCAAADPVTLKISHVGLEGIYAPPAEPTWIEITARNNSPQSISFRITAAELNLSNDALPLSEVISVPIQLAPSETRAVNVPLHVSAEVYGVFYVQALGGNGATLGRTAIRVGSKPEGEFIGLLCSNADLCRAIGQSILLSGSAEEQTHKSSSLRLVQLSEAPPAGWAYSPADVIILTAPVTQLSNAQRDALETYMHRGGKLVLVDDQLGDGAVTSGQPRFLEAYRARAAEGKDLHVGEGLFAHLKSVSSKEFSNYFRPLGFTPNTPQEIREQLQGTTNGNANGDPSQLNSWMIRRLGTTFRFPSFFELLSWIVGYLVLVGVVNFVVLRRMGKPDWAWVTIPALAVLFSLLLYAVGARNHPSNFGIDEMTVYRLDSLSPLALSTSHVRVSAPVRSEVHPVLPGDLVQGGGQRPRFPYAGSRSYGNGANFLDDIQVGTNWESSFPLRRWSFRDLEFEGQRRFPGTVTRDKQGRVHNETGVNFRQALIADERDVFFLGEFPAGAIVDLAHVPHRPYEEESGRRTSNNFENFPSPPFAFRPPEGPENPSEEWMKRSDKEFKDLSGQPFALSELIRGWSKHGENVFAETKAVFFGLSSEATLGATLRDRSAVRKAASLTVVTYGEWP